MATGRLLDHSLLVYGSPLSDGNMHLYKDLPVLLVAGGATGIQGGRHIRYPEDTPIANLYLTLLDKLGIHLETFRRQHRQDRSMKSSATFLLSIAAVGRRARRVERGCAPARCGPEGRSKAPFGNCCGIAPMSTRLSLTAPRRSCWRPTATIWKSRTF